MIKVGIIGSTGYAGAELVRILLNHKDAEIVWYGSRSYVDQNYASVYRNMFELVEDKLTKEPLDYKKRTGYQIYKKALEKGVILRPLGDVIYFNPPLIIEKEDMDFVTDVALKCTKEVLN